MEPMEPAYSTGPLLAITAAAIALLLVLVMKVRLHAFVSLTLVSLLVALATRVPLEDIADTLLSGFGETLANVGLLVGLGVMIGRMLEITGGAAVLSQRLISTFGQRRAPLALGVASLVFGLPIFFDAGFIVMLPIVFTVARRVGGSVLLYALPVAGAFAIMHAFVPPHPGPVAAAGLIGADMGTTMLVGLVLAVPTWYLGSYLYSRYAGHRFRIDPPEEVPDEQFDAHRPPRLLTVVSVLVLPMLLILCNTGTTTLVEAGTLDGGSPWVQALTLVGETPVALLITAITAMAILGYGRYSRGNVERIVNDALGPVCALLLITGAGGMFGGVLQASGIGTALATALESTGLPVIVAAFVIAAALRVAQGSATVALTTSAGLVAPAVEAAPDTSSVELSLIVIAIACGSTVLSHVNDSGFWLVGRFLRMDASTTLRTWTVMETLVGTVGFTLAFAVSLLV
ncbi:GntP family gluconate:H+ symporter [Haloactinospora alba]|uniref:GntP family gluconate:H+ symporter n=1 Tax=Haloactinospora alba TaxID=405555 RepID=A0A543NK55_9ACTN|nr:GntP family permease [Haloactinospora alba]TQN32160.1 GntP family gluconate:H+ symporter [Haloactinospora alba]